VDPDDAPSDARPVGPVLRAWRKRALLSQEQLAERARLSLREAYRICVERDDPAIEEVRSLLGDQPAPPIA
jgi:transcriptional regulator with XRE-family HTH domain